MTKSFNRLIATCIVGAFIGFCATRIGAAPVQISFTGAVTETLTGASEFFRIGEAMTGVFVYESSVPNDAPAWDNRYSPFLFPDHGFVTIAGYTARFRNGGFVLVNDDIVLDLMGPVLVDQLTAVPFASGPILGDLLRPYRFGINFWDTTASYFDSSKLPTSIPSPSSFPRLPNGVSTANWVFTFVRPDPDSDIHTGWVYGELTTWEVTIVPEPASGCLCTTIMLAYLMLPTWTLRAGLGARR